MTTEKSMISRAEKQFDEEKSREDDKEKSREEERMNSRGTTILLYIGLLVGLCLLAYPSMADYWNSFRQSQVIMDYSSRVSNMNSEVYRKLIEDAEAYNRELSRTGIQWEMDEAQLERYWSLLDVDGTGIMGYIEIPKINVKLPIYHGTDVGILQTSVGHIQETSLPVGGSGSHCALSGHRGLPSAKLFSDLNRVLEGDTFTISILNETYTYEVDQIRVVSPQILNPLNIIPGEDLCTLVTCTPYGVNSHRLLVRGHRVKNAGVGAEVIADAMQLEPAFVAPFVMAPILAGGILFLFLNTAAKRL